MKSSRTELTISIRTILRILTTVSIFLASLYALYLLRNQVTWVAISFFLALALTPIVNWLAHFMPRKSRGLAMLVVLIIMIGILTYLILVLVPPIIEQLTILVQNFPSYWDDFVNSNGLVAQIFRNLNINELAQGNQDRVTGALSNAGSWIGSAANGLFALVTIFTLTFFMVIEGPKWLETFWHYQTPDRRARRKAIAEDMYQTVSGYVNGNLLTSVIAAVVTTIFLAILGIPSPLALGLLVGLIDIIPLIGATLGAVIVSLFALIYGGTSAGIISVIFFIIYQQIENNILQPIVFAKSVQISPLVVGIAALFGATLAGFFGALVAIPVAASLQILIKHVLKNRDEILSGT